MGRIYTERERGVFLTSRFERQFYVFNFRMEPMEFMTLLKMIEPVI